jgi:hypothetical protein
MAEVLFMRGVSEVAHNVMKGVIATNQQLRVGMLQAGLFLQRESMEVVPVLTGNLRGSAFTRQEEDGMVVIVGYTANYAIYVHENLEAHHKPGKTAKYLEGPMRAFAPQMFEIIRSAVAVP